MIYWYCVTHNYFQSIHPFCMYALLPACLLLLKILLESLMTVWSSVQLSQLPRFSFSSAIKTFSHFKFVSLILHLLQHVHCFCWRFPPNAGRIWYLNIVLQMLLMNANDCSSLTPVVWRNPVCTADLILPHHISCHICL